MTLKFLLDDICLKHKSGYGHPENSERIKSIITSFNSKNNNITISDQDITNSNLIKKTLEKIHDKDLYDRVYESKFTEQTYFDHDTIASSSTFDAAHKAAGLAISAALLSTKNKSYFSIMRPPGHHATSNRAMGFCYFNSIALATQALLNKNQKVAIIDFDFHYGNGTADIFWDNPNVMYISIHADPTVNYPNQGFIDEIGTKDGKGYNVCIPLSYGSGNNEILFSLNEIVLPLLNEFKPSIIATSSGFDAFKYDPVGGGYLQYNYKGFNAIGNIIFKFAKESKIPTFHILEGGYNVFHLPKLIYGYALPWLKEEDYTEKHEKEDFSVTIKSKEKKTFSYVKQMLLPYWNI